MFETAETSENVEKIRFFSSHLTAWLCRTLRAGDVVVDVGANTGYFSLLAAALVGSARGRTVGTVGAAAGCVFHRGDGHVI